MGSSLTTDTPTMSAATSTDRVMPGTRAWFVFFVLWMIGWTVAAVLQLQWDGQAGEIAVRAWILALMCFYLSLCNTFMPMPTAWIVLLAASPEYGLVSNGWGRVLTVSLFATASTVVANLNEYHLLAYFFRAGWGNRVRASRVYGWALRWFDRSPFQILTLIAFVPIPVDAVRWLASLRGYSRVRFALAYFAGRGPRYVIFAACSTLFALSAWEIIAIQGVLLLAALIGKFLWQRMRRTSQTAISSPTLDQLANQSASGADESASAASPPSDSASSISDAASLCRDKTEIGSFGGAKSGSA